MKKFFITCIYLLLTAAVSAAGFFLPSALSSYQDKQIFARIEHTSMDPLELTYSSSLYDTLRLISKSHYFVDYPSTGSSRNADEVYKIVQNLISQFEDSDIILSDPEYTITNHTITLQLAIASENYNYTDTSSSNGSFPVDKQKSAEGNDTDSSTDITTAVVWTCSVYFVSGYWMNFWIDDKSGKAVAFSMYTGQSVLLTEPLDNSNLDKFVDRLTKFLQDYYELTATPLLQSFSQTANPIFEKDSAATSEASYIIQLTEDSGKRIQIPLCIRPEYMLLN